jgi:aspartate/methionine/tyrosine aminotransferase
MTLPPRNLQSDYMRFAKLESGATYGLASSGVADCVMSDLSPELSDLTLNGPNSYGYGPLVERIAERFAISPETVVTAHGTSFSNHLAMAALVEPGDEVLVEDPAYELLTATLGYFQARVTRFKRSPADRWRLNPDAVAERLTDNTKLVVLTNLHAPTSDFAAPETITAVAAAAARVGAWVLLDEVYLELMFRSGEASTAFHPEGNVIVTSSLTKAYGLSGLRCGWILAPAQLAHKMRRLNDLFASVPPHVVERLSVLAFDRLPALRAHANAMIDANRVAYREILGGHPALDQVMLDQGTTMFPRLIAGDAETFFRRLKADYDTSVVPGHFFGRPDCVRIGLGGDIAMTREGLRRIALALNAAPLTGI